MRSVRPVIADPIVDDPSVSRFISRPTLAAVIDKAPVPVAVKSIPALRLPSEATLSKLMTILVTALMIAAVTASA